MSTHYHDTDECALLAQLVPHQEGILAAWVAYRDALGSEDLLLVLDTKNGEVLGMDRKEALGHSAIVIPDDIRQKIARPPVTRVGCEFSFWILFAGTDDRIACARMSVRDADRN